MRVCPNCAGGLKFDIASQGLKCPNCSSKFPIGQVPESRAAKADGSLEAMIFTCPQCGGEVFSTSETAASFCSFCGASVQLAGRMAAERMPERIIPFKITKEECARKFRSHVGSYFFSPNDLKNDSAKLEFRGIYMPYWDYTVHQKAHIRREYSDEHRSGDYRIVKRYDFDWDLDEDISDIQHDASTSFDDEIGLLVSPFEPKDNIPFDSSYMEGFYGDVSDTKAEDYANFALECAADVTEQAIDTKTMGTRTDLGPTGNEEFNGKVTNAALSMFPIWFMSYRSGNRVAYSAVNGQTGKVHVDLPISIGKFLGTMIALTIAIYAVFSFLFTPTPQMDVCYASIMTIAASVLFTTLSKKILDKDDTQIKDELPKDESVFSKIKKLGIIPIIILVVAIGGDFLTNAAAMLTLLSGNLLASIMSILATLCALWALLRFFQRHGELVASNGGGIFPSPLLSFVAALLSLLVAIWNPVSDLWYYGITTASLVAGALSLLSLISLRNILCTRRMPEFDTHKGGDHRARS